ncbi:MAG: hypothetical protein WDA02_10170 [Saccharofermentanales bacterium]|jgi:ABC-2 type transport system ATP-binding protein
MGRAKSKGYSQLLGFFETVLRLEDLSSREYYALDEGEIQPVLEDLSLSVKRGEIWTFYSKPPYTLQVLLEIMGNMRPAVIGSCFLMEEEISGDRKIMDNLFYIGNTDMLYPYMNVLEALMFTCPREGQGALTRQDHFFETLIELGLGHLSLTPVRRLTREEKALVLLLAASYDKSPLVIFNLPDYVFNEDLMEIVGALASRIVEDKRSLILGSTDPNLVESVSTHTAYIDQGSLCYQGTLEELRQTYDRTLVAIEDGNLEAIHEKLALLFPEHLLTLEEEKLILSDPDQRASDPYAIQQEIISAGITPQVIAINRKSVKHALRTLGDSL